MKEVACYDEDTGMTQADREYVRALKGEVGNTRWAKTRRLAYLRHAWWWLKINELALDIQHEIYRDQPMEIIVLGRLDTNIRKQLDCLRKVARLKKPPYKVNGDWEAAKARARMYPLKDLADANSRNKAICPAHNDHHPSLHVYPDNKCHCFVCGWHGCDSIAYIMQRDGLPFADAVKALQ